MADTETAPLRVVAAALAVLALALFGACGGDAAEPDPVAEPQVTELAEAEVIVHRDPG